ncbi:MAG: hypothetical protein R3C15_19055 [Thermoleophilia bacterium]
MQTRTRVLTLAAAGAATLAVAVPAAQGTIVPQQGMAGVKLGMSQAKVQGVLGQPLRAATGSNDFGPYTQLFYPYRVVVTFQGNAGATAVSTSGVRERTAKGAGVGSTEARLKAAHPALVCETFVGTRSCHLGSFLPGKRVTDFLLRKGKVVRVTVGVVID